MATDIESDRDDQDQSEVFDEDNQNLDGDGRVRTGEMRTFEELPNVIDLTSAEGDNDDDDALIGEELDDDEIIALEREKNDVEDEDLS
jgi:hypothetical protein